jgi:hypothetical protein
MEEKKYYLFGAIVLVVFLGFITVSSYFSNSSNKGTQDNNKQSVSEENSSEKSNNSENTEKKYKSSDIKFITEQETKDKYSIKLVKPTGLPEGVQVNVDKAYKAAKDSLTEMAGSDTFGANYSLDSAQPEIHESGDYISILIEFYENTGGAHPNSNYISFSYSKATGEEVSLSDVLQNSNTNNEIYKYLSSALESKIYENVVKLAEQNGKIGDSEKESIMNDVKVGLNPISDNFLVWYVDGENITFVFAPYQVAPYVFGTQKASVYLSQVISSLKD